jgi:hypothetical protein
MALLRSSIRPHSRLLAEPDERRVADDHPKACQHLKNDEEAEWLESKT